MVSIVAFQGVDPSSILGHRISFYPRGSAKVGYDAAQSNPFMQLPPTLALGQWYRTRNLTIHNRVGATDGMFEQIAKGLHNSKVVIVFVSTEYARSENCKMEFQFAR